MRFIRTTNFFLYFLFSCVIFLSLTSCKSSKDISSNEHNSNPTSTKSVVKKYAQLLGVDEKNITNRELYSFIDDWYGTPYKYGGKNKDGIDCSNFTATLYKEAFHKSITGSSSSIYEQCSVVSKKELHEGDLVFFKIETDKVSHIGVYLQNNKFVHATTKKGVMIDDLDEAYYKKYFYKAGRIK